MTIKRTNKTIMISLVIVLFLISFSNYPERISSELSEESKSKTVKEYTDHGPIVIDDDSDFVTYGFSGSGNPGDAYMIEGLRIVSDTGKPAIAITGTITKYFKISNCSIESTNGLSAHGIEINATCSYDPLIEKTFITAEGTGIVCKTTNTYINNNTIYDSNFGIDVSSITDYSCSFVDIKRNKITNCNSKAITITDSTNNTLYSNRIYNCSWGIFLSNVQNATIEYNILRNCLGKGIVLFESQHSEIHHNKIYFQESIGIECNFNSSFAKIYNNWLHNGTGCGLSLGSNEQNCTVYHNYFLANMQLHLPPDQKLAQPYTGPSQAFDQGKNNLWYHPQLLEGNYWTDWESGEYKIYGVVNSTDPYPLPLSDSDGDGIEDWTEIYIYGTNPGSSDTDSDGIQDNEEIVEGADGYITDPTNADTDGDTLTDGYEVNNDLSPVNTDTDLDGLADNIEIFNTNTDPTDSDSDDDFLSDGDEILIYDTDPNDPDSDDDGYTDWEEVEIGTDPNDPNSHPNPTNEGMLNILTPLFLISIIFIITRKWKK